MVDHPSFCRFCGSPLSSDALFCAQCGKPITESQPASQPVSPPVPPIQAPPPIMQFVPPAPSHAPVQSSSGSTLKIVLFSLLGLVVIGLIVVIALLARNTAREVTSELTATSHVLIVTSTPLPVVNADPASSQPTESLESFFDYSTDPTPQGEPVYATVDAPDWDAMAKSFIDVDLDQCYFVSTGNYYMEGTVTNTSTTYAVENIWLRGDLISSQGNWLTAAEGYPDALMIQPGTSASFWIWANYREVSNPTCDVYVESAEIAP